MKCSIKKVFLKILQTSQENTFARASFLIKFLVCHEFQRNQRAFHIKILLLVIRFPRKHDQLLHE